MRRLFPLLLSLSVFAQDYKPFRYPKLPVQESSCTIVTSGNSELAARLRAVHVVPPAEFPSINWAAGHVAAVIVLKSSDGALVGQPPTYASGGAIFSYLATAGTGMPGSEVDVVELDKAKFGSTPSCSVQPQQATLVVPGSTSLNTISGPPAGTISHSVSK